jgi:hypothetical protein
MDILALVAIIISVVSVIVGWALIYFGYVVKTSTRLTKIETDNEVFWKVIGPHMADIIHSPEHTNRDVLVEGLNKGILNPNELAELACLLEQNISENHNESKKLASALLLARVKSLQADHKNQK